MEFVKSNGIKINLSEEDKKQLSSLPKINKAIKFPEVIAFDIYDEQLIGFAMVRKFADNCYFLWDFAIDSEFQNMHYGYRSLSELIELLKQNYSAKQITTTYIFGNERARALYEKIGFIQTDIVDENDTHEVNMILKCE